MKKQINTEGVIQMLNELIKTCHHGQQGFAQAANQITVAPLKHLCAEQSQLRAQFGADLQEEMQVFSENSLKDGFHPSDQVATAISFKLTELKNNHEIIAICKNADHTILRQYEDALTHSLPATLRSVIEHQYRSIKQAYEQIKNWESRDGI